MSPSTYLNPAQLSAMRSRLAEELCDRDLAVAGSVAQDAAYDVCRPDFGGAYLSNVQNRADARGLRAELDAVVERMGQPS